MTDHSASMVKLLDSMAQSPVTPGPNSWAQEKALGASTGKIQSQNQPTNRDKYEKKPMPKPPTEARPNVPPKKSYIQPAIPLIGTVPLDRKKRAVTDPVTLEPFRSEKKLNISQLRQKLSSSKTTIDEQQGVPYADIPGKAQSVLGLGAQGAVAPASVPSRKHTPEPRRSSSDESPSYVAAPKTEPNRKGRLVLQKAPVESEGSVSNAHETGNVSKTFNQWAAEQRHEAARKSTDNRLQVPRVPTVGTIGKVGIVQQGPLHSSGSFQGVIETAAASYANPQASAPLFVGAEKSQKGLDHMPSGELLQPSTYSPDNKVGVWEDNPAVGHTLPPFTPSGKVTHASTEFHSQPPWQERGAATDRNEYQEAGDGPNHPQQEIRRQYTNPNPYRQTDWQAPILSGNSWATPSQVNSFTSSGHPISALLPINWPPQSSTNSVPSPPHTQRDYQRVSPVSAGLAHLDLTIHHHLDSAFGSLTRHMTQKHDQTVDRIIIRVEEFEDRVRKELRELRSDFKSVKSDLSKVKAKTLDIKDDEDAIRDKLEGLEQKLHSLETQVAKARITPGSCELEGDQIEGVIGPRRMEGAQSPLSRGERHHSSQQGHSRSSSKAEHNERTRRRSQRSNTSTSQPEAYQSDEATARRAFFAELGSRRAMTPGAPDLRDHPAYARPQEETADGNGESSQVLGGRGNDYLQLETQPWYHQAYGRTGM